MFLSISFVQKTLITTGDIPMRIEVLNLSTGELYDISTLCEGFDEKGIPSKLILPTNGQITIFFPTIRQENADLYTLKFFGQHANDLNYNFTYDGKCVAAYQLKFDTGAITGIIRVTEKSTKSTSGTLRIVDDIPQVRLTEIYFSDEIDRLMHDQLQDVFQRADTSTADWLQYPFIERVDSRNSPLNPTFPYNKNDLIFTLAYNSLPSGSTMFRLVGYEDDWQKKGGGSTLTYENLSPGNYQLMVYQTKKKYEAEPLIYNFSIGKPWWMKNSFLAGISIVTISFLRMGAVQINKRRFKRKTTHLELQKQLSEAELKAIRAQLNPHFLFNSLNAIQNLVNKNERQKANDYLVKLAQLVRQVLAESKNAFHELENELKLIGHYIELEKLRYPFKSEIQLAPDIDKNLLIPSKLLQPFVENAIIHGLAGKKDGEISINISLQDQNCLIQIQDNGKGTDQSEFTEGSGIALGKQRLEIIQKQYGLENNCSLSIKSQKDLGTTVSLTLPIDL